MASFTVFLIGYGNQVPEDFLERLESTGSDGCLVLDIRARRQSWAWSYTAPQVEFVIKKVGHDYIWLHELGNAGNGHKELRLINEQWGMLALEALVRKSSRPVVLMCAERLSQNCHRRGVANKLAERLGRAGDQLEIRFL